MEEKTLQIPPEIRTFLEGLLTDAGMTTLDDQMREEMIKELFARLNNHITATIMENLPPEHLETFTKMAEEKKSRQEMEEFLKAHVPNAAEVMARAFIEFRDLYLGNVAVARNAPAPQKTNQAESIPPNPVVES